MASGRYSTSRYEAPSGSTLAKARMAAHEAFDPIWRSGLLTRSQAYTWLAGKLGVPARFCHMQMFPVETCEEVVALCRPLAAQILAAEFKAMAR